MTYRSRSTLFLIEQLIVIAIFAICAAACIRILTASYFYASDSKATSNALLVAESVAESYKAFGGDLNAMTLVKNGLTVDQDGSAQIFYNETWQVCSEQNARYVLNLAAGISSDVHKSLAMAELTVDKVDGGNLVAFPIAAVKQPDARQYDAVP